MRHFVSILIICSGLIVFLALGAAALPFQESNIAERGQSIKLWTDDGLQLEMDSPTGLASNFAVGDNTASLNTALIRLEEVQEDEASRNLIDGDQWGLSTDLVENATDGAWLRVSGENDVRPKRTVRIDQTAPQPLVLSGWCRAEVEGQAFGWQNRNMALNANALYSDGTRMPEQSAYFGQYDHGPQFNKRIICPERPIQSVDLDLSVLGGRCLAWYRDVQLKQAHYRILSPTSPLERVDHTVRQEFILESAALRGLVTYRPQPEFIEVGCSIESTQQSDRAISGYLAIPFDAVGGLWHDDVRKSRRIEPGQIYRDQAWYGAGRDGYNNRYPFASVEDSRGRGLAIGTSIAEPRVFQTEYDSQRRELRIRFDLGISPDSGRWANRGYFTAYLFGFSDGFRGAAERYYRMFPWAFENRVKRQGTWLAFMNPLSIGGGWGDFHFKFLESVSNAGWARGQGMYSLRYTEPWINHHEFPPHVPVEEVHGSVDPKGAITTARRIAETNDQTLPLDMRVRYPAYQGSYIEDKWGNPQGYFFRDPKGGRNENMMIVNPDPLLFPPSGSMLCSGQVELSIIRDALGIKRQWHIPGWTINRVSEKPFFEIDDKVRFEGKRSARVDPVEGKSYFEQHLRGITQIVRYSGHEEKAFTFSYHARAEDVPKEGTVLNWQIIFWYADGKRTFLPLQLSPLVSEWRFFSHSVQPEKRPSFISVVLTTPVWTADPTVLWVDDVTLTAGDGEGKNLLENGGFEEAELLQCEVDGSYLDVIECYTCNLNYRRSHWICADAPPTFDESRSPALHQIFSNLSYVKYLANWFHPEGRILFGNCVPCTPFVAPYLDILGTELNWKQGDTWNPWPDSDFNFARFMARGKPYCMLQYADLSSEEQARYMKRCLFYGVIPSNQAAPSGGWYWADPIVVDRHRPVYAKYTPAIIEVAEAGWQPVTLARTDDEGVWIERFGEGKNFYLTVFNSTREHKKITVTLDARCGIKTRSHLTDVLSKRRIPWKTKAPCRTFQIEIGPEDVAAIRIDDL